MSLSYKKLEENHLDLADEHLIKFFFGKEPLGNALNATDPNLFKDWLREFTQPHIKENTSFGCFDGESLVGCVVISTIHKDSTRNLKDIKEILDSQEKDHPLVKIFQFMEDEVYNDIDLFENTDPINYVCLMSVDSKYVGKRIGTKLLEMSEDDARKRGIREFVVETTGKYSGKVFEKSGYSCVKTVPYNDTKATYFHNLGEHTAVNLWRKMM